MIYSPIISRLDLILTTQKLIRNSDGQAEIRPSTHSTEIKLTFDSPNLSISRHEYELLLHASMQAALNQIEISELYFAVDATAEKLYINFTIPVTPHNTALLSPQPNNDELYESVFES